VDVLGSARVDRTLGIGPDHDQIGVALAQVPGGAGHCAAGAAEFCATLPERCGVVAIPTGVFYDDRDAASTLVRFAFCKRAEVIAEASDRLASLG
jgi:aspartate/methionine/tyrosine aminotransferase